MTKASLVDIALLTQALDRPDTDIPETDILKTLYELAGNARLAVPSYLGLRLTTAGFAPFTVSVLEDRARREDVHSSLRLPVLSGRTGNLVAGPALILYGARAGAFVDLAADLSWLSDIELSEYVLDQHLATTSVPVAALTVQATSVINQAIGVLIERGRLPEKAQEELNTLAADVGTDQHAAAVQILSTLATNPGPVHDP